MWVAGRPVAGVWSGAGRGAAPLSLAPRLLRRLLVSGGEDVDGAEPGSGQAGPVLFGGVRGVHAEAVAAGGVVVEFGGDVRVDQGGVIDDGVPAVAGSFSAWIRKVEGVNSLGV